MVLLARILSEVNKKLAGVIPSRELACQGSVGKAGYSGVSQLGWVLGFLPREVDCCNPGFGGGHSPVLYISVHRATGVFVLFIFVTCLSRVVVWMQKSRLLSSDLPV